MAASGGQQGLFGDDQIGQGKQDVMLGAVLLQALVAQFAMVEAVFEEVEDMLDPAADLAFEPFDLVHHRLERPLGSRLELAAFRGDVPLDR